MENDVKKNARALLIAPNFFGYAQEIKARLEQRGVPTLWFNDLPAGDTMTKILVRISPQLQQGKAERYFDDMIEQARDQGITQVLVIKGQSMSCEIIRRLRAALPQARFTLYFWDSYQNMSSESRDKVALFDRTFTFDPVDAEQDPRLEYRALFYLDEYTHLPDVEKDIDLFFFGTVHSDRYQVLCQLEKSLPPHIKIKKILYFSSRLVYWARRLLQPAFWMSKKSDFIFKPVPKAELKLLLARSRVVLDIERPVQAGLTMRTLEAVGARKKIITTNPFARKTDIYTPENVLVIDRKNIVIPEDFFLSDFSELTNDVNQKYSLDGWLNDVFFSNMAVQGSPSPLAG